LKRLPKPFKILFLIAGILLASGFVYLYYNINPAGQEWMPKCPFHTFTGFHCPGCGSQRAIHDFLHLNFLDGFKHNFLLGLGVLVMFYKVFLIIRSRFYPEKSSNLLYSPKVPWIILILIISFWVLRNLPFAPFSYLAP
jgi:hypothetical protein